ncbi:MAG: hypothetical protein J6K26_09380 [Lachnospiraceae bacterium]|nr:hypothetical protein [Lachnospiraceae bacterium]
MQYTTISSLFTGICDAIRKKEGSTGLISHQEIPARIEALSSSSGGLKFFEPEYLNIISFVNSEDIVMIEEEETV